MGVGEEASGKGRRASSGESFFTAGTDRHAWGHGKEFRQKQRSGIMGDKSKKKDAGLSRRGFFKTVGATAAGVGAAIRR